MYGFSRTSDKINPLFPLVYFLGAPMFILPAPSLRSPAAEYDWLSALCGTSLSFEARDDVHCPLHCRGSPRV